MNGRAISRADVPGCASHLDDLVAHRLGNPLPALPPLRSLRLQALLPVSLALLVPAVEAAAGHVQLVQGSPHGQGRLLDHVDDLPLVGRTPMHHFSHGGSSPSELS